MEALSVTEGFEMVVVLYTVKEAVDWLKKERHIQCSPGYLSERCRKGELPAILAGRTYLVTRESLERFTPGLRGRPRKD